MTGEGEPTASAPGGQPALPKRFYRHAAAEAREGAFALLLDGRPARTPARAPLAVASQALAAALAEEWEAQAEVIDPARMPITRLVNSAIDGVAPRMAEVRADLLRYAGSDLVCYRAGEPAGLVEAQGRAWDPILAWSREALGARFILSEGVNFVAQPEQALERVCVLLEAERSAEALAALHLMTTLTGSLLIALALTAGFIPAEEAWLAAHVDELFQEARWGRDQEALERREARRADFLAAARVHALAHTG